MYFFDGFRRIESSHEEATTGDTETISRHYGDDDAGRRHDASHHRADKFAD